MGNRVAAFIHSTPVNTMSLDPRTRHGLYFGIGTYLFWGVSPMYFKVVQEVSPAEVLAHRVIWSMVFLAVIITLTGNWHLVRKATSHIGALTLSAVLIATNWLIFIWAIGNDRMVESSLGYFISPMVSVMLGLIFLSERLRPGQWWAISLAVIGILVQLLAYGKFPWVALSLALSFGVYGLIRKRVEVPSIAGLMLETSILAPIALAYLCYLGWRHDLVFMSQGPGMDLLLMCAGIITTLPLLGFASAVIRLSLVTLGLLQYVAPTIMLTVAVLFYGEPFTPVHLVSFTIIWSALAIFSGESYLFVRKGAGYVKI